MQQQSVVVVFFFLKAFYPTPPTPTPNALPHFSKTPITQDMFAWHACGLIHCDSFLFLLDVERNRNDVPRRKTLFTNVASACPAWSSGLFLLHYMAGNRSWLGLAHVLPPSLKTAKFNHSDCCTLFTLGRISRWGLQPHASFHAEALTVQTEEGIFH